MRVAECWLISHCHINIFNELLWLYFCNFPKGERSFPHLSHYWQTTSGHVGGFYDSSFWMQNNLMKVLDLIRLEILNHPISSLADKGTWPQRSTCQAQSASLRTLIGDCWLIQKPWRSCLPSGSLLWWWLSWASTAQASPTWWTSWLGRTRVSDTSRAQPSPFCPPTLPACSTVMWGEEVRDLGGILKANFQSTVMFLSSLWPERISSPLFTLCLSFCFKSINCSFPRKTNVVIKIGNVYNNKL